MILQAPEQVDAVNASVTDLGFLPRKLDTEVLAVMIRKLLCESFDAAIHFWRSSSVAANVHHLAEIHGDGGEFGVVISDCLGLEVRVIGEQVELLRGLHSLNPRRGRTRRGWTIRLLWFFRRGDFVSEFHFVSELECRRLPSLGRSRDNNRELSGLPLSCRR